MKRLKQFIFNGLLLTVVSLIMRSVSVSFQVYLSNRIGASAMGVFSLISTVYGFAVTLATSGIQLATTKLIAEELGSHSSLQYENTKSILKKCISYAMFFSLLSSSLLFFLAPSIGTYILKDTMTVVPLRIFSLTLCPIAISAVFNGYFTAVRRVWKNATVQVIGEGIRITACIMLLSLCLPNDTQYACIAIIIGGLMAELCALLIHGTLFAIERYHIKHKNRACNNSTQNSKDVHSRGKLLGLALPVAFSAYVRSALVTIEHLLIPKGLEKSGSSRKESLAAYGTLHSMVFPLILYPAAISSSFAGLLIPEITESSAKNNQKEILRTVDRVFETVLTYAIGVAGIMICFSAELGGAIYPKTDAAKYIMITAPLIPVMYLDTSVDSILKGLGQQVYHMTVNIIDSFLSVVLVIVLLPRFGILGYVITVYFTETVNATLSITRLLKVTHITPKPWRWVFRPLLCISVATVISKTILNKAEIFSTNALDVALHIIFTVILYALMILITKFAKSKPTYPQKHNAKTINE